MQVNNKTKFLLVIAFLTSVSSLLSQEFQSLVSQNKIRPTDAELYINKKLPDAPEGTLNLLTGLNSSEVGITNFDGDRLEKARYFVIDSITVNYGVALDGTSPSAVNYNTALPTSLKAAELRIKQADSGTLFSLPIGAIDEAKATDTVYRELGGFQLLREEKKTSIEIEFASGSDLGVADGSSGFIQVLLKGFQTMEKR